MNCFMTGVLNDLQEECHSYILYDIMNMCHFMVNSLQGEETRDKSKIIDPKRERSFCGGSSKSRHDI